MYGAGFLPDMVHYSLLRERLVQALFVRPGPIPRYGRKTVPHDKYPLHGKRLDPDAGESFSGGKGMDAVWVDAFEHYGSKDRYAMQNWRANSDFVIHFRHLSAQSSHRRSCCREQY